MMKCTEMQELSSKVKEMWYGVLEFNDPLNTVQVISETIKEIYEGQEGEWMHVVKNQVSSGLESVNDNINEVQLLQYNLSETRAEAQEQREKENRRNETILSI